MNPIENHMVVDLHRALDRLYGEEEDERDRYAEIVDDELAKE